MCNYAEFFDEGKIVGAVEIYKEEMKLDDEEILQRIKERFQLNDYQAKTFVYPKETATV